MPDAYSAKFCTQNCMAAVVASRTSATLKRKEFMSVAPGFIGCTVKTSTFRPTLAHPLMVATAKLAQVVTVRLFCSVVTAKLVPQVFLPRKWNGTTLTAYVFCYLCAWWPHY